MAYSLLHASNLDRIRNLIIDCYPDHGTTLQEKYYPFTLVEEFLLKFTLLKTISVELELDMHEVLSRPGREWIGWLRDALEHKANWTKGLAAINLGTRSPGGFAIRPKLNWVADIMGKFAFAYRPKKPTMAVVLKIHDPNPRTME
jgi:hypothetical protein